MDPSDISVQKNSSEDISHLKNELRAALERRGVINTLKSRIRSEIYHCLEAIRPEDPNRAAVDMNMPEENVIINEMIREYLQFNGYTNTLSVFLPESQQAKHPTLERVFLQSELGLSVADPDSARASLPLMYEAVAKLRRARTSLLSPSQEYVTGKMIKGSQPHTHNFQENKAFTETGESIVRGNEQPQILKRGFSDSQRLDDLVNPNPISFKNI